MFQLTRPSAAQVNAFVAAQQGVTFSYPEVGATASGPAPAGYKVDRNRVRLGTGAETFRRATAALLTWRMSSLGWMSIQPANAPVTPGETAAAVVRHFGFWSLNACRVVYLLDEEEDGYGGRGSRTERCPPTRRSARNGSPSSGGSRTTAYGTTCTRSHVRDTSSHALATRSRDDCSVASRGSRSRRCSTPSARLRSIHLRPIPRYDPPCVSLRS